MKRPYKPELKVDSKPLINRYVKPTISDDCDLKTVEEWPVLSHDDAIRKACIELSKRNAWPK